MTINICLECLEENFDCLQPAVTNELLSRLGIKSEDLEINDVSQSSNDSDLPESTSTPVQVPVKDEPLLWKLLERLSNLAVRKVLVSDEKENIQEKTEPDTKPPSLCRHLCFCSTCVSEVQVIFFSSLDLFCSVEVSLASW